MIMKVIVIDDVPDYDNKNKTNRHIHNNKRRHRRQCPMNVVLYDHEDDEKITGTTITIIKTKQKLH